MLHNTPSGAAASTSTTGTGNCIPYGRAIIPGDYSVLQLLDSLPKYKGEHLRFSVLAKTGVAVVPSIEIEGHLGVWPVALTYVTAFALIDQLGLAYATSYMINGHVYAADSTGIIRYAQIAVIAMSAAYGQAHTMLGVERNEVYPRPKTDISASTGTIAPGTPTVDHTELGSGILDTLVLYPGIYEWSTAVGLSSGQQVTLYGTVNDTFVFQAAGSITFGDYAEVLLVGGLTANTVFWTSATNVILASNVKFFGIILAFTNVVVGGDTHVTGQIFSQTEIAFAIGAKVTIP